MRVFWKRDCLAVAARDMNIPCVYYCPKAHRVLVSGLTPPRQRWRHLTAPSRRPGGSGGAARAGRRCAAVEMEIGEEGLGKSLALRAVSYGTGSVASARPLAPHNSSGRESSLSCSLI